MEFTQREIMNYRNLGKTGLKISELSYGSWITFSNQLDEKEATEIMKVALDNGVNFFDNAEAYASGHSEIIMGNAIRTLGLRRDSYIISSKVFWGGEKPTQRGLSHKHVIDGCTNALERMGLNYLDLYFCHRPDPETPIEETVRAMHTLILQGKICYWGTSEWPAQQIQKAYQIARDLNLTPPAMEQPEYNMFNRERMEKEYTELFEKEKLGTTIWSPLCSGLLTGKYKEGIPSGTRASLSNYQFIKTNIEASSNKHRHEKVEKLSVLASNIGIPLSNLAICWCLKNKAVSTVILGASKKSQLIENLASTKYLSLVDSSVTEQIEKILLV
tara:strand:+ start:88592 stop:89581 length:990 start_codon:yes stop_codon:yes gene_type:complete